jgi:predicted transposase/invertase (TIGR01784 family)
MSASLVTTADLLDPKNDYVFFRVFSEEPERLSAWIAYFEHWREESTMSNPYPPVQRALEKLRELSADEEARYWAEARAKALSDEASLLSDAREEGREEGREEASRNTAQNLIGLGVLTDVQIAQATGLTVAQVEALLTSQTD